jgi:hypothetical protein
MARRNPIDSNKHTCCRVTRRYTHLQHYLTNAMSSLLSCVSLSLFVVLASFGAIAQDKKAPEKAAGATVSTSVPKHNCVRPDAPGKFESDGQQKLFVKQMDGYRDCLMAFRNDMNKLAQAHIDAANAAIDEFNSFVNMINKK